MAMYESRDGIESQKELLFKVDDFDKAMELLSTIRPVVI